MPQIINTNINSLTAQRNLNNAQSDNSQALNRLSSGLRINSSKDDAAGLAISTRFESQISGLNVATRNAGDGVSLSQTAEGGLDSITNNLSRLRELAVQSANATNTAVDREALNAEATQIIDEIGRISEQTNFNGVKLLDGNFQAQTFQVGANVGETIDVSIAEVTTSTLGSADTAGISSNVDKTALVAGTDDLDLAAGDIVINGVSVGASSGSDDTSSRILGASSALSKAAAINAVSDLSGVSATADVNTVEGTAVATIAAASDNVTINGVAIAIEAGVTTDAAETQSELQKIADSINEKSGATGVVATVMTAETGGAAAFRIDLSAEDGRNIDLVEGTDTTLYGLAAGGAAAATANVYVGNVTLTSDDGSDFTVGSTTGDIDNAGFEEGTFGGANGGVSGDADTVASGRAALTAGDLTINGVGVGLTLSSDDNASTVNEDASAIAVAAAINKISDQTGVTAEAGENTIYSGDITVITAGSLTINGEVIAIGAGTDVAGKVTNAIDAINAKSGKTGVTAEALDGDSYKLVAADGRNIQLTGGGAANDEGFVDSVNVAGVNLKSAGEFTLGTETGDIENAGLNVGTFGGSESGTLLKDVDISTVAGANAAITAVDNALTQVNTERANLGAIQNRFDNTISSNQINSENLSAANSRIKDADFAAETAALSRSSVLQQAGISILAQANAQPQQVLSLLG